MKCPTNVWERWADGSIRLTTGSNLLNLIVWREEGPAPNWHYRIVQLGGLQLRRSRRPAGSPLEAERLCEQAARRILGSALKALETASAAPRAARARRTGDPSPRVRRTPAPRRARR